MSEHTKKLGLSLPVEDDFYDIGIFNDNFKMIDASYEEFEENICFISEDGSIIVETYPSGSTITQINGDDTLITESFFNKEGKLLYRHLVVAEGRKIQETREVFT